MSITTVKQTLESKLSDALQPELLELTDESHLHAGHAGANPDGESHFRLYIVAPAFKGKRRIDRHRMIHTILSEELAGRVHALAIRAYAPDEVPPGQP